MRDSENIVFAYHKGSSMLKRYIEINSLVGVAVWRDGPKAWQVMMMSGESTGFVDATYKRLKDAKREAKRITDHTELPFVGVHR